MKKISHFGKPIFYQNGVDYFKQDGPFEGAYANVYKVIRRPEIPYFGSTIALKVFKKSQNKETYSLKEQKGLEAICRTMKSVPMGEWNLNGLVPILSDGFLDISDKSIDKDSRIENHYKAIEYQWINTPYITLKDYIKEKGPLHEGNVKIVFSAICRAINGLHKKGIVHRDIHVGNIFINKQDINHVLIIDYGLVRINPAYLNSKERLEKKYNTDEEIKEVLDIVELGKLLYYLLTGNNYKGWISDEISPPMKSFIQKAYNGIYKEIKYLLDDFRLAHEKVISLMNGKPEERDNNSVLGSDYNKTKKNNEKWSLAVVEGVSFKLLKGIAGTRKSPNGHHNSLFPMESTVILGDSNKKPPVNKSKYTIASWIIPITRFPINPKARCFLLFGCLRHFGGLHSPVENDFVDIYLNNHPIDGFEIRIIPEGQTDYFHQRPYPTDIPKLYPFSICENLYAWSVTSAQANLDKVAHVLVRIAKRTKWDIDYIGLMFELSPTVIRSNGL